MGLLGETGRISIHAPRTGSDKNSYDFIYNFNLFQSTLPARGATTISIVPSLFDLISIHAPRTGSDIQAHRIAALVAAISIHAPRTGSDMRRILMRTLFFWNFNPRSPHGERRPCAVQVRVAVFISIHAPRTGSDPFPAERTRFQINFNPRSPHGERRSPNRNRHSSIPFQSTLPARGATLTVAIPSGHFLFQSTLPARGATLSSSRRVVSISFQSTLPARGATGMSIYPCKQVPFQSTLPARGATSIRSISAFISLHFNPRSPHGERHVGEVIKPCEKLFQSTLPARGATQDCSR